MPLDQVGNLPQQPLINTSDYEAVTEITLATCYEKYSSWELHKQPNRAQAVALAEVIATTIK